MTYFTQAAIDFFKALKQNNDREWFLAHKAEYQNHLQEPAIELVMDLGKQLQTFLPNIAYDTTTNGSGSVMRIHRDVRFSKDKTPYKTWLGIRFWEGLSHKHSVSKLFFYFSDQGGGIYVGNYGFDRNELLAFQKALDDDRSGPALEAILKTLHHDYDIGLASYKNVPRLFAKDHPRAELLKHKSLYAHVGDLTAKDVTSDRLVGIIIEHFKRLHPLHQWLTQYVKL